MGYCIAASDFIVERMKFDNEKDNLRYEAFRMYFRAAFCEEFFKFFIAASIPFITKYNKSKSAILNVSIMVGLAFDLVENVGYSAGSGWVALIRVTAFCAHFVFAYPTALAITRQRDSLLWPLEVLAGFSFGVLLHGTNNYITTMDIDLLIILHWILHAAFLAIGLWILIKNPFLPKR